MAYVLIWKLNSLGVAVVPQNAINLWIDFNQSMENVVMHDSLQTLTFGDDFNQSLDNIDLPGYLQSLTFGNEFNKNWKT